MSLSIQEINQTYDQTNKDMPRQAFIKKMQDLMSQAGVQRDLEKIVAQEQAAAITAARERQKIDRAISRET